ncbi:MAG: tyrosine-type recombinase/integrase [Lachnospiraceae bacterium]|jgi:integrase|nr:tyrosine-type recombinase/integrase [Lachnospiraceae bacterium]MDE6942666.1 tyrosine-type recombinase/integrase [Lachnospiraceae bacterium]
MEQKEQYFAETVLFIDETLKIASCGINDLTFEQASSFLSQWEDGATLGSLTLFINHETGYLVYEFVSLLLCTGMRSGEAAALTWDDIDYKQNVTHVTETATFNEGGTTTVGSPKSEAGNRDIPLNDSIKDILIKAEKKAGKYYSDREQGVYNSIRRHGT